MYLCGVGSGAKGRLQPCAAWLRQYKGCAPATRWLRQIVWNGCLLNASHRYVNLKCGPVLYGCLLNAIHRYVNLKCGPVLYGCLLITVHQYVNLNVPAFLCGCALTRMEVTGREPLARILAKRKASLEGRDPTLSCGSADGAGECSIETKGERPQQ